MTAPITAARTGGLSFRLGGIPVTIHVSFLLVITLLGLSVRGVDRLVVWVLVATAAILLHELGHAVVGRLAGLTPRIDLAGFGGVTSWSQADGTRRADRRGWSLAISLAGPGIGFVGGGLALLLGAPCCLVPAGADLATFASAIWLFASFAWGILNLLPILPLDGGQALRALLPGTPVQRLRRAAVVGVLAGIALTGWALASGLTFLALLAGWITWSNVQQFRAAAAGGPVTDDVAAAREAHARGDLGTAVDGAASALRDGVGGKAGEVAMAVLLDGLLRTGRSREAWGIVRDPRREVAVAPELLGRVLAAHPEAAAVDAVVQGWVDRGADRFARGTAAVVALQHGDLHRAASVLRDGPVDAPVAFAVRDHLHDVGEFELAGRAGQYLVAESPEPIRHPLLVYNTACSLALAGHVEEAVEALRLARRLGFTDDELLRRDPDLRALRDHPAWPAIAGGA